MLKVLGLVSFRIYPTLMGGQKGVALFYRYLKQHATVVLAASTDNETTPEVTIKNLLFPNKRMPLNLSRVKALRRLIHSHNIDLIIAEHSYTAWIAWQLHRKTGTPFIIHSHNIESKRFQQMHKWWWKWYQRYEGWIHRKAYHNFFISEEDREFAINRFHLNPVNCSVITYGVEHKPATGNKTALRKALGLSTEKKLLLFNGTLDYTPNYDAVLFLVDGIDPLLQQKLSNYQIIITGNRAPEELIRKMQGSLNVHYAGYVENVDEYYQAADLFINPVSNDTGVKTKLIEAIANNCTAVSTESGSSGIKKELCGGKLVTVADNNWEAFADKIVELLPVPGTDTPSSFYDHYEWSNIAKKAAGIMKQVVQ